MAHNMTIPVVYVAGPFRAETPWLVEGNVRAAESWGMRIAEIGAMPLVPHANTRFSQGFLPDQFWLDGTLELMRRCDVAFFIPGWEASEGSLGEQAEARARSIPNTDNWAKLCLWISLLKKRQFNPERASDPGTYGL